MNVGAEFSESMELMEIFLGEEQKLPMDFINLKQIKEIKKPNFIVLMSDKICQEELDVK